MSLELAKYPRIPLGLWVCWQRGTSSRLVCLWRRLWLMLSGFDVWLKFADHLGLRLRLSHCGARRLRVGDLHIG